MQPYEALQSVKLMVVVPIVLPLDTQEYFNTPSSVRKSILNWYCKLYSIPLDVFRL